MKRISLVIVQASSAGSALVTSAIKEANDVEIVGTAPDFNSGLDIIGTCQPDIILVQSGPHVEDFSATVSRRYPDAGIIIMMADNDPVSTNNVVAALASGAIDFLIVSDKRGSVRDLLLSKIRCYSIKRYSRHARKNTVDKISNRHSGQTASGLSSGDKTVSGNDAFQVKPKFDAVLIGVSTGGPEALMEIVPGFPDSFPVPVIIVLHMPKEFTGPMAAALGRKAIISVKEAEDGEELSPGKVYLAPGGYHCLLQIDGSRKKRLHIVDGPAENGCKPSVDVLFRSAAPLLGKRTVAVVLTGMGSDGKKGSETVKQNGGVLLAQDEETSIVWGMPGSVVRAGLADEIVSLNRIAPRLCELMRL